VGVLSLWNHPFAGLNMMVHIAVLFAEKIHKLHTISPLSTKDEDDYKKSNIFQVSSPLQIFSNLLRDKLILHFVIAQLLILLLFLPWLIILYINRQASKVTLGWFKLDTSLAFLFQNWCKIASIMNWKIEVFSESDYDGIFTIIFIILCLVMIFRKCNSFRVRVFLLFQSLLPCFTLTSIDLYVPSTLTARWRFWIYSAAGFHLSIAFLFWKMIFSSAYLSRKQLLYSSLLILVLGVSLSETWKEANSKWGYPENLIHEKENTTLVVVITWGSENSLVPLHYLHLHNSNPFTVLLWDTVYKKQSWETFSKTIPKDRKVYFISPPKEIEEILPKDALILNFKQG
jgi:hypothetical protein